MPLVGRYGDTTGRPYIEGRLVIPRFSIRLDVSFLVDTGADCTVLMPDDGTRAGLDYSQLIGNNDVGGIGGQVSAFVEPALAIFSIPGKRLFVHSIDLLVFPSAPDLIGTPSLLGRNILDRWRCTFSASEDVISFDVLDCDSEMDLTRP